MRNIKRTAAAVFAVILAALCITPCLAGSTGWGLSYQTPGQTPQGSATREALLENDAYYAGDDAEKVIYLTFDAGYEAGYTQSILEVLKRTQTPAAFFIVGTYIRDNPELVKQMAADGHVVANHTQSHPDMSAISDMESFRAELSKVETQYSELTGMEMPKYYRPPRGVFNDANLQMAKELGYKTIFWSLAYVDWIRDKQPSREEAFSKLLKRAHPGMVLLLHSTSKTNAEILEELIGKYREMGYEFKSLEHLTK